MCLGATCFGAVIKTMDIWRKENDGLKINKHNNPANVLWLGIALLAIAGIANIFRYNHMGIYYSDYIWEWKEFACTIKGIDVSYAIDHKLDIEGIGQMPDFITTVPWGRMLGQLLQPGWLPMEWALIYTAIIYAVAVTVAYVLTRKFLIQKFDDTLKVSIFVALVFCMPFYWADVVQFMNNGTAFCFFLIIVAFIDDNNEIMAGFLMALAMIKPQNALIFYVVLLFRRRFTTIISSGVFCLISWIIYLVYVGGNPIEQIMQIGGRTEMQMEYWIWYGFLDPLRELGISDSMTMLLSMFFGVIWVCWLIYIVQKSQYKDDKFVLYAIAAMGSVVWSYKSTTDIVIVIMPSLLVLYAIKKNEVNIKNVVLYLVYLGCLNVKIFAAFFRVILGYEMRLGLDLDAWLKMVVFTLFVLYLCRESREIIE